MTARQRSPIVPRDGSTAANAEPVVSEHARRLHRAALVVDGHADTPSRRFLEPGYRFDERHADGHLDLPRMREGGINAQFMIAFVPAEPAATPGASAAHADRLIDAIHHEIGRTPGVRLVGDTDGIAAVESTGDAATLIGVEGGHAIENSLDRLRRFHARGARYLTLTWNNSNDWADASMSPPRHGGLTEFGCDVVRELNRLRMLVDVSHAAPTTVRDVLELSRAPVVASHSCARALTDHPRNLDDDQLRGIARTGGIIGVAFVPDFLDERFAAAAFDIEHATATLHARLAAEYDDPPRARRDADAWRAAERARLPLPPLSTVIDHIDHLVRVAGIDHVALGSDFDGVDLLPLGLNDAADLPRITELLLRRGYADDAIRKILGENLLRVLCEVLG